MTAAWPLNDVADGDVATSLLHCPTGAVGRSHPASAIAVIVRKSVLRIIVHPHRLWLRKSHCCFVRSISRCPKRKVQHRIHFRALVCDGEQLLRSAAWKL